MKNKRAVLYPSKSRFWQENMKELLGVIAFASLAGAIALIVFFAFDWY